MSDINRTIAAFTQDRDVALLSLDKEKIEAFSNKWSVVMPNDNKSVFWTAVHKARIEIPAIPEHEKKSLVSGSMNTNLKCTGDTMNNEPTLLPCPACGQEEPGFINFEGFLIRMECLCGCGGPLMETKHDAIAALNAMPRHLTWTSEPPKEPGLYWCRHIGTDKATWNPAYIPAVDDLHSYNMDKHDQIEWAGPIPMPKEPNE